MPHTLIIDPQPDELSGNWKLTNGFIFDDQSIS